MEMMKQLLAHGFSGYLIIGVGLACILISVDRLFYLYSSVVLNVDRKLVAVKKAITTRNYSSALQICGNDSNSPELVVIRDGIMSLENGREAIQSALTSAVLSVSKDCEKRLPYLSLIASSATLLGLFGTIMGLMTTFRGIAGADPAEKGRLLGLGISEAMNSTAAGVIVGVAAMAVHTICISRSDLILGKAQHAALQFVRWIEQAERKNEPGA